MPLYEYYCPACRHKFEQLRPMAQATAGATCPECEQPVRRTVSMFARVGVEGEATFLTPDDAGAKGMYSSASCCGGGCGCS